jgi:hypothetical protein
MACANHLSGEPAQFADTIRSGRRQNETAVQWRAGTHP